MRFITLTILLLMVNCYFSQDTIKLGVDLIILESGKVIQKEFNSSKNYIKVVYQYDEKGILKRRMWYNKEGKLLSVCLDN